MLVRVPVRTTSIAIFVVVLVSKIDIYRYQILRYIKSYLTKTDSSLNSIFEFTIN